MQHGLGALGCDLEGYTLVCTSALRSVAIKIAVGAKSHAAGFHGAIRSIEFVDDGWGPSGRDLEHRPVPRSAILGLAVEVAVPALGKPAALKRVGARRSEVVQVRVKLRRRVVWSQSKANRPIRRYSGWRTIHGGRLESQVALGDDPDCRGKRTGHQISSASGWFKGCYSNEDLPTSATAASSGLFGHHTSVRIERIRATRY